MTNPFTLLGLGQLGQAISNPYYSQAQQAYNPTQQYYAQQAQQAQAFAQYAQQEIERRDWRIDGKNMTMREFADTLWPDDCAEKTHFYLKYSK